MQSNPRAAFAIIMDAQRQCAVWPAARTPPPGWRFTPARGTRQAMQSRVDQQFVETAPGLPAELEHRPPTAPGSA
jgi:uncharacterized protein YbdZ (MbtH family)